MLEGGRPGAALNAEQCRAQPKCERERPKAGRDQRPAVCQQEKKGELALVKTYRSGAALTGVKAGHSR